MKYKEFLNKPQINGEYYDPIMNLFKKSEQPLSIKEISSKLNLSYSVTKQRLHKMAWNGVINLLKRGYYCLPNKLDTYSKITTPPGKILFLNGGMRMRSLTSVGVMIYNSIFGEKNKGKYGIFQYIPERQAVFRKSNNFYGNKIHLLKSKSVEIPISRTKLSKELVSILSKKSVSLKIGIYPEEWGLTIKDLFSTEAKEEGELAEELNKFGQVDKKNKFQDFKADILFTKNNKIIPIEITVTNPFLGAQWRNGRKSGVKSSLIFERLYFFIKWNLEYKTPTILIIHKDWTNYRWIKIEQEFMRKFNCHIFFTDFKSGWVKKVSREIIRLIA